MLKIRNAELSDLGRILEIYRYAQDFMIKTGNPTQWGRSYPEETLIRRDIARNACKVLYDETGIHGVFALFSEPDPTYAKIENGRWLNDEPYLTIHRMAGDGQVHGLFSRAADYCKGLSRNIRIDTHGDNQVMQKCIEQNGFRKCGTISVRDGSPRLAYQWTEQ